MSARILSIACALFALAGEARASGIAVDQLLAAESQSFAALLSAARVEAETEPAPARKPSEGIVLSSIPLDQLMQTELAMQELFDAKQVERVAAIPRTLPKTTKVPENKLYASLDLDFVPTPVTDVIVASAKAREDVAPAKKEKPAPKVEPVSSQPIVAAPSLDFLDEATTLEISRDGDGLSFKPKALSFAGEGRQAKVVIKPEVGHLDLFVRDSRIIAWEPEKKTLTSMAKGSTELYMVSSGKMYIVPISVETQGDKFELAIPTELVSLEGVVHGALERALYPDVAAATSTDSHAKESVSLRTSRAATQATLAEATERRFLPESRSVGYTRLDLQVIDERSDESANRLYPVVGARLTVIGTELVTDVDATGHVSIRDVPRRSRLLIAVDDPEGAIQPAMTEVSTGEESRGVIRIKTLRSIIFDAYQRIAGVVQDAGLGSLCVTLVGDDGYPVPDLAVSLDVGADGPFYFNRYGYLDPGMTASGPDGRACYFNVLPGPVAMIVTSSRGFVGLVPVSAYTGRHKEETVRFDQLAPLKTRLAAMATAHEQLSNDITVANTYRTVDVVDLIPLGTETPMAQLDFGLLESADTILFHGGRAMALARAAEFEQVLYSYEAGDEAAVTPLIPRGFVEDMALYAQVVHDSMLGVVLIEHGDMAGQGEDALNIRLVDEFGRDVGSGWYYADSPTTKAIFFNVPPGIYTVLAETGDRYWIGVDTVAVYNETVSYLRMGSPVRYRP